MKKRAEGTCPEIRSVCQKLKMRRPRNGAGVEKRVNREGPNLGPSRKSTHRARVWAPGASGRRRKLGLPDPPHLFLNIEHRSKYVALSKPLSRQENMMERSTLLHENAGKPYQGGG